MVYERPSRKIGLMPVVVAVALSVGVLIALWIAGSRQLTNTESVLLALLLSSGSMLVSWLATHLYSQFSLRDTINEATESNTENTRSLAVRAAEKVLNLSNELQRLVDALNTAMEDADEMEGSKQPAMLLRERIVSAVHILETLKSMNDTFLSDWRGIIGDEIDRQQTLEKQIEALTDELHNQIRERNSLRGQLVSPEDLAAVQSRIDETEQRLTEKIGALPFKVAPKSAKPRKEDISLPCASCDAKIEVRLRTRKGARKLIRCSNCENYSLVTVMDDGEMDITPIPMYEYTGICPICTTEISAEVPDHPGAMTTVTCASCDVPLLLSKSADGANLRIPKASRRQMSQRLIDAVLAKLPKRPWPTHIHKSIAKDLGISNSVVSRIIGHLIEQGHFPLPDAEDLPEQGGDPQDNESDT